MCNLLTQGTANRLSREELYTAMQRIGVRISLSRVDRMLADMDIDHNRVVDYREFMRKASQVRHECVFSPKLSKAPGTFLRPYGFP